MDRLNAYNIELDNHTIHELVRYDPGVEIVEHNVYVERQPFTFPEDSRRRWTKVFETTISYFNAMVTSRVQVTPPVSRVRSLHYPSPGDAFTYRKLRNIWPRLGEVQRSTCSIPVSGSPIRISETVPATSITGTSASFATMRLQYDSP